MSLCMIFEAFAQNPQDNGILNSAMLSKCCLFVFKNMYYKELFIFEYTTNIPYFSANFGMARRRPLLEPKKP